jgi:hypothetical protein
MTIEKSVLTRSEDSLAFATKEIIQTYLGDYGVRIAEALVQEGQKLPPVLVKDLVDGSKAYTPPPERQLSWGITKIDDQFRVAIILETADKHSAAVKVAEFITNSYHGVVVSDTLARAHSSDPGKPCQCLITGINPGASISHHSGFPGTVGAIVRSTQPDNEWQGLLGAAHVLAHNKPKTGPKTAIFVPSKRDGKGSANEIAGYLENYKYLNSFDEDSDNADYLNCVDAAVIRWAPDRGFRYPSFPDGNFVYAPDIQESTKRGKPMPIHGFLGGVKVAERIGTRVCKLGRTSGFTVGELKYIGLQRQIIKINTQDYVYTNVLGVSSSKDHPFSQPGDSGALVYTEDGFGIGLIIGGTHGTDHVGPELTYISPLDACLRDTDTDLVYPQH